MKLHSRNLLITLPLILIPLILLAFVFFRGLNTIRNEQDALDSLLEQNQLNNQTLVQNLRRELIQETQSTYQKLVLQISQNLDMNLNFYKKVAQTPLGFPSVAVALTTESNPVKYALLEEDLLEIVLLYDLQELSIISVDGKEVVHVVSEIVPAGGDPVLDSQKVPNRYQDEKSAKWFKELTSTDHQNDHFVYVSSSEDLDPTIMEVTIVYPIRVNANQLSKNLNDADAYIKCVVPFSSLIDKGQKRNEQLFFSSLDYSYIDLKGNYIPGYQIDDAKRLIHADSLGGLLRVELVPEEIIWAKINENIVLLRMSFQEQQDKINNLNVSLQRKYNDFILFFVLLGLASGLIGSLAMILASRKQAQEVYSLSDFTNRIASGHLQTKLPLHQHSNEIKTLAKDMDSMRNNLQETINELEKANLQLKEVARLKEEFFITMSHELRTPLNGIIATAEILMSESDLNDSQLELLSILNQSSQALLNILNDILDYSKLQEGKVLLEIKSFDVARLVHEACCLFRVSAINKGLTLEEDLPPFGSLVVQGDEQRLRQVLYNLIGNSLKFTKHGSISCRIKILGKEGERNSFEIKVEDTGIGMTDEQLERLFEPFTQADMSVSRKYGGTGLGLSIAKQFIELMNGSIQCESEYLKGTSFKVNLTLPVGTEEHNEEPEMETQNIELKNFHFLIAEDNTINQRILERLLEYYGSTCDIVDNGAEAISCALANDYDCILLDLQMPVMSGIEAAAGIREKNKEIPILAVSANISENLRLECIQKGFNGYLEKPYHKSDIRKMILNLQFNDWEISIN
ncbi:MAG: ATP-binding protein [Lentisphaeria bacterium]|nr:ATP-binding protein [Lentisphaeria bacterium]